MNDELHDVQRELEGLSPALAQVRRAQGETPGSLASEDHLQQLAAAALVQHQRRPAMRPTRRGRNTAIWLSLAAGVCLLFGIGWQQYSATPPTPISTTDQLITESTLAEDWDMLIEADPLALLLVDESGLSSQPEADTPLFTESEEVLFDWAEAPPAGEDDDWLLNF